MKDTIRILLLIGLVTVQANESQSKTQMADWPYYQIIVNSNLFHPLRWRPSSTKPKYELIATKILSGGSSKALIRETNSNKTYYVGIGDQIQGTKVEKIEENQVRLNIGNKPISLSGGGLQFLSLDQEHRNKRKGAKERSKNRRRNEGDQSQKGKNKSEKKRGKERRKNISGAKGNIQEQANGWIDWAKNASPAERRAAWDSEKFRNLSPEVQGAIRKGIDD